MAEHTILIRLKSGKPDQLELSNDNGKNWGEAHTFYTQVAKNDYVIWQLDKNSDIDKLTGIEAKDGRFNLFPPNQPKAKKDGTWQGKVKDIDEERDSYNIKYVVGSDEYIVDPILETKPPGT
jgi:hypothetical protein